MDPLLFKYNDQRVSRYSSYPTAIFWAGQIDEENWRKSVAQEYDLRNHTEGLSLNLQLPFCERICSFCGCNTKNSGNLNAEERYLESLKKQWAWYRKLMRQTPVIRQIHIGGSKPVFFSPANLKKTIQMLTRDCILHPNHVFSIQFETTNINSEYLHVLAEAGFRKISYKVQADDAALQHATNPDRFFEPVQSAISGARSYGFQSVNVDLIVGMHTESIPALTDVIKQLININPDRIVFDSDRTPGKKEEQISIEKKTWYSVNMHPLFRDAKHLLTAAGYLDIGLYHFARSGDPLENAFLEKTIRRTFMGYEASNNGLIIGLGVAAISDIGVAYGQNSNTLNDYQSKIDYAKSGIQTGYFLTEEDKVIRHYIFDICTKQETTICPEHVSMFIAHTFPLLYQMQQDGLLTFDGKNIQLTPIGQQYIEQICSTFDLRLYQQQANSSNTLCSPVL